MDGESEGQRKERLRELWLKLDTKRKGFLDMPDLKRGLNQMNHRKLTVITPSRVDLLM